jgi:RNA polymerase sigma-70 factor (ECF subfamily)
MSTTVTSTTLLQGLRQEGNDQAWREFCARYGPVLMAFARRAGFQEHDAQDVIQETLVVFLERFRAGDYDRKRGRLRAWLQGIAFNKVCEAQRRPAQREVQVADAAGTTRFLDRIPDDHELTDLFEQEWERAQLSACLQLARAHVDPQTFQAFRLYALEDWPADRVAANLGITRDAVYVHKSRVLRHLRELQRDMEEIS